MIYKFQQLFYRCVTAVHVGCGDGFGIIDMPIIREKPTNYPVLPGSGLRGTMRVQSAMKNPKDVTRLFGAAPGTGELGAGCVTTPDARILLLAVRSAPGVFHWVTCPFVVTRYLLDHHYFLDSHAKQPAPPIIPAPRRPN